MSDDDKKDKQDNTRKNPWAKDESQKSRNKTEGSWSSRPSSNSPFDRQGRGGGNQFGEGNFREMGDSLKSMLPADWQGPQLVFGGIVVLILLWLASGLYFLQPSENAVVLTFGKYSSTVEQPGLKWHIPWPVQSEEVVNVTNERRIEIGYQGLGGNDPTNESLMLTGDENIIDIDFVVLWRINNAADYLFKIRDTEATIKIVAESAMREIMGQTKIQPALTEARNQIQVETRELMQQLLDQYQAGVTINNVQLQKVDPPTPVIDAFNDVQRARQQKEELRNKAEAYRNDIIPRARGEAEKLRQQAEAYKASVINRAKGDAQRFNDIYAAYREGREVTMERMYLETMEDVIDKADTLILDSTKSNAVPYLSLNELKAGKTASGTSGQ
ncbi:MAG: FtsH protease activity modulator HflK [Pseudobdellovibrionaceae bacterium]